VGPDRAVGVLERDRADLPGILVEDRHAETAGLGLGESLGDPALLDSDTW
jgi:hypothetical protein